jgi:hypothetical protein
MNEPDDPQYQVIAYDDQMKHREDWWIVEGWHYELMRESQTPRPDMPSPNFRPLRRNFLTGSTPDLSADDDAGSTPREPSTQEWSISSPRQRTGCTTARANHQLQPAVDGEGVPPTGPHHFGRT